MAMTGCNSVYFIALMHHKKRPLTDFFYPHNVEVLDERPAQPGASKAG